VTAAPDLEIWRSRLAEAVAANDAGQPARAERAFRALILWANRGTDHGRDAVLLRARAHLGLATSSFDRHGRLSTALAEIDAAELLAREAAVPELLAAVLGQRGLLHLRAGDTAGALAALAAATAYLDAAEPFDRMTILLNRGALYLESGDHSAARVDLARCVDVAVETGHRVRELMARHNLGYAEFLAGNLPRALAEMAAAERLDPSGRGPMALLDQARVLREAGLPTEAETRLRAAQELYAGERLWQGVGETLLTRAECALSRDAAEAVRLAAHARRVFRRRTNVLWERKAEHVMLVADLTGGRAGASTRAGS
jgi:tetratricopeptide (TPR) repeat protein